MQTTEGLQVTANPPALAFRHRSGRRPGLVFLCGLASSMSGAKAAALAAHAEATGRACTLFDYRGHGASSQAFERFGIGDWLADTLAILDGPAAGPAVLVGSSMGGWLALLAALRRPEQARGLVLIAPAPDFTAELIRPHLVGEAAALMARDGKVLVPSAYGPPLAITQRLLDEAESYLLLGATIPLDVPVHILHGQEDPDVPWATSLRLAAQLTSSAVTVELVKDGDHRLARESDLRRMLAAVDRVVEQVEAAQQAATSS
jgi:pimeloyl-ACP methyl ester carboxylesterase